MGHLFNKWVGDFAGNTAAFVAATLFGASVVATRVVVQGIPLLSMAVLRFGQGGLILFLCPSCPYHGCNLDSLFQDEFDRLTRAETLAYLKRKSLDAFPFHQLGTPKAII